MKDEVWRESNYVCYICEKQMHKDHPELTVDHMKPKAMQGSLLKENMACCCDTCNVEKGSRTIERYTIHMIMQLSIVILWYRLPVSRYEMRRDSDVRSMWGSNPHSEEKEEEKGAAAAGEAPCSAYPQPFDLLNQRLFGEAGGAGEESSRAGDRYAGLN
ncbi:HNH endonuclease [compost metagenome]